MNKLTLVLMTFFMAVAAQAQSSGLCAQWGAPQKLGNLNNALIKEASGIVVSKDFPNRLYHINDSGDEGYLYTTDFTGITTNSIKVNNGYTPVDMEEVTLGVCPNSNKSCVFLGDIGDNQMVRTSGRLTILEEPLDGVSSVHALRFIKLVYPDGARNAEGMAVHPNGDLYIVTKEKSEGSFSFQFTAAPARVYRAKRESLDSYRTDERLKLEFITEIDVPAMVVGFDPNAKVNEKQKIVTGFSISPDGSRFLLLTYLHAIELLGDLALVRSGAEHQFSYNVIKIKPLIQQEAIAYTLDGQSFLYHTEADGGMPVPLMMMTCEKY